MLNFKEPGYMPGSFVLYFLLLFLVALNTIIFSLSFKVKPYFAFLVSTQILSLMSSTQLKNHHLMWRAGFGPAADQLAQLQTISHFQLYKALQKASSKKPEFFDVADNYLKGLVMGI